MRSVRHAAMVAALICMWLTSCGDKKAPDSKPAPKHQAGEPLYRDLPFSAKHQPGEKFSPEQQAFFAACKKVKYGMSEQEVDAVLRGYPSKRLNIPDLDLPPGHYIRIYDDKPDSQEYDYYLQITFDENHAVVDGICSEYAK